MKKTIAFISLAAAVLAACNKQEANPTPEVHYLKASSTDETKTTLSFGTYPDQKTNVLWRTDDQLSVYTDASTQLDVYTLDPSDNGKTSGTFTLEGSTHFGSSTDFKALYPSSMISAPNGDMKWPSVQLRHVYYPEQVDTPMYGEGTLDSKGNPSEVKLHNLGGILKVTATFPSDRGRVYIKTVVISTTDVISGKFTIDSDNKAVPVQENGEHCIQLNCNGNDGKGVDCSAGSSHDFDFAVPASDADGYNFFTISFFDNNGKLYAQKHMKKDSENKWLIIEQGKITTLSLTLTAPRAFSVASDKKVVFAPGNLMVTSDGKFAFDFDSTGAKGFYWSKNADVAKDTDVAYSDTQSVDDVLFTNNSEFLINGVHWRALTSAEWDYLLKRDSDPGHIYSDGGYGIYIHSDGYAGGEDSGQVFLPFTQEDETARRGYYWTADAYDRNRAQLTLSQKEQAITFNFSILKATSAYDVNPDAVVPRGNAHAIRLVVDVK